MELLQQLVRPIVEVSSGGGDDLDGVGGDKVMAAAVASSAAASQDSVAKLLLSLPSLQRDLTDLLLEQIPAMQCVRLSLGMRRRCCFWGHRQAS